MLLSIFRKHEATALEVESKKKEKREKAERNRKEAIQRKEEEAAKKDTESGITELSDAEAIALQRELDNK